MYVRVVLVPERSPVHMTKERAEGRKDGRKEERKEGKSGERKCEEND